ncbi:MAG: hypothetical protein K2Y23_25520 [Cyanobacteria bacterium]|nr:hypothetical protein [Cyanobacteriota bacterium]
MILTAIVAGMPLTALAQSKAGVLLLAHGGQPEWNHRVQDVASRVDRTHPTEVAFGMASRAAIAAAIDRLKARGVTEIVAVPLFVSSHSSVISSTEYLLGLRPDAPADLAQFARMSHGRGDAGHAHADAGIDPASPIAAGIPVRITPAFNRHAIIGAVLADRTRTISTQAAEESVILVAHGPVPDDDNRKWLDDLAVLADQVRKTAPYASVDYMTVRDDAGPAIRDAATQELRAKVDAQRALGRRVLIVPHLLSFGGIEQGIRKRLDGLDYAMAVQGLMPDDRIVDWVLAGVK